MSVRRPRKGEKREKKRKWEKERRRRIVNLAYLAEHWISIFQTTKLVNPFRNDKF